MRKIHSLGFSRRINNKNETLQYDLLTKRPKIFNASVYIDDELYLFNNNNSNSNNNELSFDFDLIDGLNVINENCFKSLIDRLDGVNINNNTMDVSVLKRNQNATISGLISVIKN
jgi:hypothetical protein